MMIKKLEWHQGYAIDILKIDFQHLTFLQIINELIEMFNNEETDNKADRMKRKLSEVIKYTKFHFESEENVMLDNNFPNYAEHKKLHIEIIDKLDFQIYNFENNTKMFIDFIEFLKHWFFEHIVTEDIKISDYFKKHNILPK